MDILPKGINKNKVSSGTGKFSFGQKISSLEEKTSETKLPLVLSLVILVLVGLSWFGLIFYKNSLNKNIEDAKQRIESLRGQENKEMQTKIIALEKNLKNVKELLARHIYSSQLIALLEKLTLPQVQWTDFNLKIERLERPEGMSPASYKANGLLSLKGQANSYSTLAKQILIFEAEPKIKEVKASGISLSQVGGVGFNMEIILNSEIFKK